MSSLSWSGLCQLVILLSVEFSTVSCDTFYIVTSPSSPCPGEYIGVPCLTLQQYAANPAQSQSVTFLVKPGIYNLSTVLTVSDGYNFTMSSTNVTVTCTSTTARFEINRIDNVYISGITFQGCRTRAVLQMSRVTSAIIRKSNFTQNQGNSVQVSNSAVTIDESNFYDNGRNRYTSGVIHASDSKILIKNSSFNNNTASGSVIYVERSNVSVDSSKFSHNAARYGGAIYVFHTSEIKINDAIFYGNSAYEGSGGAMYVATGGNVRIQINNTTVDSNRADRLGGAMYIYYSGDYYRQFQLEIMFHNTTAYSNTADLSNGGAIYIYVRSPRNTNNRWLSITQCQFINNTAGKGNGGAIALYESTETTNTNSSAVTKCQFINNVAWNASGGAIFKDGRNTKLVIDQNSFDSNSASAFGGAIYVSGVNNSVYVTSTAFVKNTAVRKGGGAIYSNGQYANVTLTSSTFHYNSAFFCGVLHVENYTHYSVNLTNSIFTYNTAFGQTIGGGVACIRNASTNIINSTLKHNHANSYAGVFYTDESQIIVDESLFINNSAALDGGVFYTYIHASDYFIRRSQFSENIAGNDGGVMLTGRLNCYFNIDETIFTLNSAGKRGGVVSMIASSMFMEINRTNIFNNTAQFGGVISACNSQVTLVGDSLFVTVDPLLPFCKLYDGNARNFNITSPPETVTEANAHTEEIPMSANPTSDQTNMATRATTHKAPHTTVTDMPTRVTSSDIMAPHTTVTDMPTRAMSDMASQTTVHSDAVTMATTSATRSLEGTNQSSTGIQSTTSALISDNKYSADVQGIREKMTTTIAVSATSLIVSLCAILVSVVIVLIICTCKKGSLKNTLSKIKAFSINPSRSFHKYTSPIYTPNSGEDEDEDDADAL